MPTQDDPSGPGFPVEPVPPPLFAASLTDFLKLLDMSDATDLYRRLHTGEASFEVVLHSPDGKLPPYSAVFEACPVDSRDD